MPPKLLKPKINKNPKKGRKKKGKKGKKAKNKDYCADVNFNPELKVIFVEHGLECPIFREKADTIFAEIKSRFDGHQFILNCNNFDKATPKPGAFEIAVARNCRLEPKMLWSGLNKGPPRRDKFPTDMTDILNKISNVISEQLEEEIIKDVETYGVYVFSVV
jgi:hypothetical protein